jgi:hypothetical protein
VKQFEKFELSLLCGLPNEVDFAFNTLLLLSSTNDNDIDLLPLYQTDSIRLIDLLLAHVGFFDQGTAYTVDLLFAMSTEITSSRVGKSNPVSISHNGSLQRNHHSFYPNPGEKNALFGKLKTA